MTLVLGVIFFQPQMEKVVSFRINIENRVAPQMTAQFAEVTNNGVVMNSSVEGQ